MGKRKVNGSGNLVEVTTSGVTLVARIAEHFMSLAPDEIDSGIDETLHLIGEHLGVDRSYAFRVYPDWAFRSTHEWCAPGIEPQIERLQDFPADSLPWFSNRMRRGRLVSVPRVADLPKNALSEKTEWESEGIRSLIAIPLESAGRAVGFLGCVTVKNERIWSEEDVELLRAVGGIVVGAVSHHRAQQQLMESQTHLAQAQGAASLGLWTWDVRTDGVTLSSNAFRIYGLDPATFGGTIEDTIAIFHPDDLEGAREAMEETLRVRHGVLFDFRIRRPDGGERLIHSESHAYVDENGEVERVIGVIQDVTERRLAEESRRRLSTAIEQVADAVMITDADGRIRYVNPAFERVTGHVRENLLGRHRRILRHGRQDADDYQGIADTVNSSEVWSGRVYVRREDGSPVLLDTTVSPVHDTAGNIVHHVAVQRDITREAALEEQLRQVQKMEAVGMLAGGIAHDFNNLLISIIGHSDLLLMQRGEDEEVRGRVEEIRKAGERAKALTSQLLAFSRKQVLRPRALDLGNVLGGLGDLLRRVIGEDIELIVREPEEPVVVMADPGQMEQVVVNLAANARDAMPSGGTLEITVEKQSADAAAGETGPLAVLTVRDTGAGMDAGTQARIFEPFFTTKGVGRGTGLGLATVYGIVRQSGGRIDVESAVGRGTVFRVFLQSVDMPAAADDAPAAAAEPRRGDEVVLVVEDDASVASIVRHTLDSHGYQVLYAENGRHALEVADAHEGPVNLLFTDVVMPEMGGVQLAAELTSKRPDLRVLYSSGYTNSALVRRGSLLGGVQLLQKPFSPATLIRRVREALDA